MIAFCAVGMGWRRRVWGDVRGSPLARYGVHCENQPPLNKVIHSPNYTDSSQRKESALTGSGEETVNGSFLHIKPTREKKNDLEVRT